MKAAILSDSHDHIPNLRLAIYRCNQEKADLLIHCGDLISPFMLPELARFHGPVHLIYGNNVGDQHLISQRCSTRFPTIMHHGTMGDILVRGKRLAFTHTPEFARGLAHQQIYDLVCCGHNHTFATEQIGACLLLNAGELLGKDEQPGFCIVDLTRMQPQRFTVGTRLEEE